MGRHAMPDVCRPLLLLLLAATAMGGRVHPEINRGPLYVLSASTKGAAAKAPSAGVHPDANRGPLYVLSASTKGTAAKPPSAGAVHPDANRGPLYVLSASTKGAAVKPPSAGAVHPDANRGPLYVLSASTKGAAAKPPSAGAVHPDANRGPLYVLSASTKGAAVKPPSAGAVHPDANRGPLYVLSASTKGAPAKLPGAGAVHPDANRGPLYVLSASTKGGAAAKLPGAGAVHPDANRGPLYVLSATTKGAPAGFSAIYSFGDWTLDVGSSRYLKNNSDPYVLHAPYGENFAPGSGRYSNGRVVGDYIARYLHLPIAPTYLKPGAKFRGGANFASGRAGVLSSTFAGNTIPLEEQVAQFTQLLKTDTLTQAAHKKALYILSFYGNDYVAIEEAVLADPAAINGAPALVAKVVAGLIKEIQVLYGLGARRFLVMGASAVGCAPLSLASTTGLRPGECSPLLNKIAALHNAALGPALTQLQAKLRGAHLVFADYLDFMQTCALHPKKQGFAVGVTACCGAGLYNGQLECGAAPRTVGGKLLHSSACQVANSHVFWDLARPSQHFNRYLARRIWSGGKNSAYPINLQALSKLA